MCALPLETAVCSHSSTRADDTTAVPESTPNEHGAPVHQITITISYLGTAEGENVRNVLKTSLFTVDIMTFR